MVNNRLDFVVRANNHDVEAVFAGQTHRNWKFGESYPDKIGDEEGEIDSPDTFNQDTIPFDWHTVYIETENST